MTTDQAHSCVSLSMQANSKDSQWATPQNNNPLEKSTGMRAGGKTAEADSKGAADAVKDWAEVIYALVLPIAPALRIAIWVLHLHVHVYSLCLRSRITAWLTCCHMRRTQLMLSRREPRSSLARTEVRSQLSICTTAHVLLSWSVAGVRCSFYIRAVVTAG